MAEELKVRVVFDTGQATPKVREVTRETKVLTGSFTDLNARINAARIQMNNAAIGSTEFANATRRLANAQSLLLKAQADARTGTAGFNQQSGATVMTLQSLNYTLRDSPYFFKNFQMGILAVGNNLNPLIDGLIRMKANAKVAGTTLGKELAGALKGPGGVIFLFSVLVSALQAVSFAMEGTSKSVKDLANDFDTLKGSADKMVEIKDPFAGYTAKMTKEQAETLIKELDKEIAKFGYIEESTLGASSALFNYLSKSKELTEEERALKMALEEKVGVLKAEQKVRELLSKLGYDVTEKEKKTREKTLILTDEQIRKQMEQLKLAKELTNSARERYLLAQKEIELQKELTRLRQGLFAPSPAGRGRDIQRGLTREQFIAGDPEGQAKIKDTTAATKELSDGVELLNSVISLTGNTFASAFIQGRLEIDKFLLKIAELILQMLIIKAITSAIFGTPFTPFGNLGGGGIGQGIASPLGPANLSKVGTQILQPTFIFENIIDTQEIVLKGVKNLQGELR